MVFLSPPKDFNPKMRVAGCFVECGGEILLLHRQPWKPDGNTWSLPAGKLEPGETPLEAVVREVREETGIELASPELRLSAFVRLSAFDIEYSVFRVSVPERPGVRLEPDAHQDFRWVRPADALAMPLIEDEDACIKLCYDL